MGRTPGDAPRGSLASTFVEPIVVKNDEVAVLDFAARYKRRESPTLRGGMSDTRVSDATFPRSVTLRAPADGQDVRVGPRFTRAARLQAQLEHPAIVPVYDFGLDADGKEFMTLPAVRGLSLGEVIDRLSRHDPLLSKRFSRSRLLPLFQQICLAVDYVHARGVVHRKLEPDGIILGDHGEVYLVDFSLAKPREGSDASSPGASGPRASETLAGEATGVPGYAAPEQLAGDEVDARADVYSLGAILFEMLALSPLHLGDTVAERIRSTHGSPNACPSARLPDVGITPALDAICVRATANDPRFRFPTARELHDAVARTLEADQDSERRIELAAGHAEAAEAAAIRAMTGNDPGLSLRAKALEEAGRAFALDRESPGARRALRALLRSDPKALPKEARRALAQEEAELMAKAARFGMFAYSAFLMIFLPVLFTARSTVGIAILISSLVLTIAAWYAMYRQADASSRAIPAIVTSSIAIGCASGLYGALVLVPPLAVANTLALMIGLPRRYRTWVLCCGFLALLGPLLLERLGVLPQSYVLERGTLVILPVVRDFKDAPVRLGLLLSSTATIVAPTLFAWRVLGNYQATRERLRVHTWLLGKLLPREAGEGLVVRGRAQ